MPKNLSKIYQRTAFIILAIIISSLLNICLFAFQAKAAFAPMPPPKFNFVYNNDGNCVAEPMPEPIQSINRPATPMPQCCLAQNRYYNAVVNIANNKSAPTFSSLVILPANNPNFENNFTHYISRLAYPPPASLALASIVIREWNLINLPRQIILPETKLIRLNGAIWRGEPPNRIFFLRQPAEKKC